MNNPEMIPLGEFLIAAGAFGLGMLFLAWLAIDDPSTIWKRTTTTDGGRYLRLLNVSQDHLDRTSRRNPLGKGRWTPALPCLLIQTNAGCPQTSKQSKECLTGVTPLD